MKILITKELPYMPDFSSLGYKTYINKSDGLMSYDKIKEQAKDADAIVSMLADKIDREIIDSAPNLKVICNYAVGYNNIDFNYAKSKGIIVCNTPDVLTDTTAELAWALLMATARKIVESDRFMQTGKFKCWLPDLMLGQDIVGKTLGIIGTGRIGTAMGKMSQGFRMPILYTRKPNPELDALGGKMVDMDTLIKESDYISLHCPLNNSTKHLFTKKEFEMMKNSAIIVNTARGAVIKEQDLVEALNNGEIAGAGLDVFENEPIVNKGLMNNDKVVIAPHIGSGTLGTRTKMAQMSFGDCFAVLNGKPAKFTV